MTTDEFVFKLKTNLPGAYMLFGEDEYTKDFYISKIRKNTVSEAAKCFNHIKFDTESLTLEDFIDSVQTLPVADTYKLVELSAPRFLDATDKELAAYTSIFNDLPPYIVLLIVFRKYDFDDRLTAALKSKSGPSAADIFKSAFAAHVASVEFVKPDVPKATNWARRHFQSDKIEITDSALNKLIAMCGTDLYILLGEINKLSAIFTGTPLTETDIEACCCPNVEYQTFDLTNAIADKNVKRAKEIFKNLKGKKTDAILISGALIKNLSDVQIVKSGLAGNVHSEKLAADMKVSQWALTYKINAARKQKAEDIDNALEQCRVCDKKLKSFSGDPYSRLELLLEQLLFAK